MNRAAQCARLTAFYPSASPGPDRAYYDLGLKLSSQSPAAVLTLRTELPPDFPQVPPILRFVNPNVAHPWLDAQGRVVGLHDLYNWDWRVSDLGDVVHGAMTEFTLHPPRLSQPAPPPPLPARPSNSAPPPSYSSSRSSPPSGPASGAQQQQRQQQQQQHADQVQVPPIPSDFPELQRLNMAQLQALLDSETTFMSLFNSLSVVSNVNDIRQAMQTNNVALATRNVESQAPVEEAKARIQSLGEQLRRSRGEFEALAEEHLVVMGQNDPHRLADELERLAHEADDESEALVPSLHARDSPEMDAAAWSRYRELRVLYHTRMAKAERCRGMPLL